MQSSAAGAPARAPAQPEPSPPQEAKSAEEAAAEAIRTAIVAIHEEIKTREVKENALQEALRALKS